jgi:hypothetical protein
MDAATIDKTVLDNLTAFLGDVERWRDRPTHDRDDERPRLEAEVDRATDALADDERKVERFTAQWERLVVEHDDEKANIAMESLERARAERDRAMTRLAASGKCSPRAARRCV